MIVRFFATVGIMCVALVACNKSETAPTVAAETPLPEVVPTAPEMAPTPAPEPEAPPNPAESREWVAGEFFGAIKEDTTEADVKRIYGAANVKRTEQHVGEGETIDALVVYPKTPDEFTIAWHGDKPEIDRITVIGKNWHSREGIRIGTTLADLVKTNGKPINFYGFAWDYGGTVSNWNRGKLQTFDDSVVVRLTPPENWDSDDLIGDSEFSSDDAEAKRIARDTKVFQIVLGF